MQLKKYCIISIYFFIIKLSLFTSLVGVYRDSHCYQCMSLLYVTMGCIVTQIMFLKKVLLPVHACVHVNNN